MHNKENHEQDEKTSLRMGELQMKQLTKDYSAKYTSSS